MEYHEGRGEEPMPTDMEVRRIMARLRNSSYLAVCEAVTAAGILDAIDRLARQDFQEWMEPHQANIPEGVRRVLDRVMAEPTL